MAPAWPERLKAALLRRARILLGLLAAAVGLGYGGGWHWFAELFAHFFIQYWLAALVLAAIFFWARSRGWALAALALLALCSLELAPFFRAEEAAPAGDEVVALLQFNAAQSPGRLESWLAATTPGPDLILLLEATPDFVPLLERLRPRYPHQWQRLQEGPFGIALLSRRPFARAAAIEPIGPEHPGLDLRLESGGRPLRILGIHPPPPLGELLAGQRDRYMDELAGLLRPGEATLVLGDLNSTVWSPRLRAFMARTGMADCQRGLGLAASWPAATAALPGVGGLLGLPIDLCLKAGPVRLLDRRVEADLGSDHLPVLTRFSF